VVFITWVNRFIVQALGGRRMIMDGLNKKIRKRINVVASLTKKRTLHYLLLDAVNIKVFARD
jgi:hypothetical protein